jgi:hypothetical protein
MDIRLLLDYPCRILCPEENVPGFTQKAGPVTDYPLFPPPRLPFKTCGMKGSRFFFCPEKLRNFHV